MKVGFNSVDKEVVHGERCDVHLLPFHLGNSLHFFNDVSTLVRWEDVWHVSCVQQHVDVLNEGFVLDLAVAKEKRCFLPLYSCFQHQVLQIVTPVRHAVVLGQFDLEQLVVIDEGGEFGGALSPRSADADQQQVAVVLFQHTADSWDVLDGELKHDEVHGRFADVIKLPEVEIHHLR